MESREALFDIPFVVYRVGSSGRESKANHPQTLIPLMIMEINLGSPQHASVAAPFHFSFHRCNDVPRVCVCVSLFPSLPLLPPRAPRIFVALSHASTASYARARARRSLFSFSLSLSRALPSSPFPTFVRPSLFSSPPFSVLFHLRLASPRPLGSRQPLLSTTLALPRSSNLPIVRFRRIRRTVMDYRSAHGRRSIVFLTLSGIVIAESSLSCQTVSS